jgi:hypothetical protein
VFADTEIQIVAAPEENYRQRIAKNFSRSDAINTALALLEQKGIARGANPKHLETEITQEMEFNMVRGFNTTGKNIRVKAQIKPGLIQGYEDILRKISGN